jgi:hypothetical protein
VASGGKKFVPVFVKISKLLEKLKGRLHKCTKEPNDTHRRVFLLDYFLGFRKCDAVFLLLNPYFLL